MLARFLYPVDDSMAWAAKVISKWLFTRSLYYRQLFEENESVDTYDYQTNFNPLHLRERKNYCQMNIRFSVHTTANRRMPRPACILIDNFLAIDPVDWFRVFRFRTTGNRSLLITHHHYDILKYPMLGMNFFVKKSENQYLCIPRLWRSRLSFRISGQVIF